MLLGVLSDLHWTRHPDPGARWHEAFDVPGVAGRVCAALEWFTSVNCDAVVVAGDLTHRGELEALIDVRSWLSGYETCLVGGNHDERLVLPIPTRRVGGHRLVGVELSRRGHEWVGTLAADPTGPGSVVISHFPLLPTQDLLAANELAHAGDLAERAQIAASLSNGATPILVLAGHLHVRAVVSADLVLQLNLAAIVEPPHEATLVDVDLHAGRVVVDRRSLTGTAWCPATIVPDRQAWLFDGRAWHEAPASDHHCHFQPSTPSRHQLC